MAASPNLRFINPSTMSKPPGYTHVVEATGPGRIVYIAGQLGLTLDGKLAGPPGDFRAQATQAFENLKNALAAVGAGFEHVVKLNNYLTDIRAQLPLYRDCATAMSGPPIRRPRPRWRSASSPLKAPSTRSKPSPCCRRDSGAPIVAQAAQTRCLDTPAPGQPRRSYPLDPANDSRLDGRRPRFRVAKPRAAD